MPKPFHSLADSPKMKRHDKGFPPRAVPNQDQTVEGSEEMADASQYSDSTSPINPEQSEDTRPHWALSDAEIRLIHRSPWVGQSTDLGLIAAQVCRQFGVSVDDIIARDRGRIVAEARHMFCLIAYGRGFSLQVIGDFIGWRDHTTILNSIKRAKQTAGLL